MFRRRPKPIFVSHNDATLFETFFDSPVSIEAPKSSPMLKRAVGALLSTAVLSVINVVVQPVQSNADIASYDRLIGGMQHLVDREIGMGKVLVVNRRGDLSAELNRLDGFVKVSAAQHAFVANTEHLPGVALKGNYTSNDEYVCVVAGPPAHSNVGYFFDAGPLVTKLDSGRVTDKDMQEYVLYHEIGHCLNGASEEMADAFAGIMMKRKGRSDVVHLAAALREVHEWSSFPNSGYMTSRHLYRIGSIDGPPEHGSTALRDVAAEARALVEANMLTQNEIDTINSVRTFVFPRASALNDTVPERPEAYLVPDANGAIIGDLRSWLHSVSSVPEFNRLSRALAAIENSALRGPWQEAWSYDKKATTDAFRSHRVDEDPDFLEAAEVISPEVMAEQRRNWAHAASGDYGRFGTAEGMRISYDRSEMRVSYDPNTGVVELVGRNDRPGEIQKREMLRVFGTAPSSTEDMDEVEPTVVGMR